MNLPPVSPELMVMVADRGLVGRHRQRRGVAGGDAGGVGDDHAVLAGVGGIDRGEGEGRGRRAGDAAAVGEVRPGGAVEPLPLVGERRGAAGGDGERRVAARGDGAVLRLLGDGRGLTGGEGHAEHLVLHRGPGTAGCRRSRPADRRYPVRRWRIGAGRCRRRRRR